MQLEALVSNTRQVRSSLKITEHRCAFASLEFHELHLCLLLTRQWGPNGRNQMTLHPVACWLVRWPLRPAGRSHQCPSDHSQAVSSLLLLSRWCAQLRLHRAIRLLLLLVFLLCPHHRLPHLWWESHQQLLLLQETRDAQCLLWVLLSLSYQLPSSHRRDSHSRARHLS